MQFTSFLTTKEISAKIVNTSVFFFKLQLGFLLLKEKPMAVLGGRKKKEKKRLTATATQWQLSPPEETTGCRVSSHRLPPPSSQSKKIVPLSRTRRADRRPSESSATRKRSPDSENRSGCRTLKRPLQERMQVVVDRPEMQRQRG